VVGVVADHVGSELANGDAAAFGVNSECVPLLGGECAEEVQVGLAQQAVQEERVVGFSGCIVAEVCPEILVEADQGDSRMFDDLAVAPSSGDLIFGEMSEDSATDHLSGAGFRVRRSAGTLAMSSAMRAGDCAWDTSGSLPFACSRMRAR